MHLIDRKFKNTKADVEQTIYMTKSHPVKKIIAEHPKQAINGILKDEEIIAPRCFRVMLWLKGNIFDNSEALNDLEKYSVENRLFVQNLYNLFNENYGEDAKFISNNFKGNGAKIKVATKNSLEKAAQFIKEGCEENGWCDGVGVRRYGAIVPKMEEPCLPYFRVEGDEEMTLVECALPIDGKNRYLEFDKKMNVMLASVALHAGLCTFGWFLPPRNDSINGMLIATFSDSDLGKQERAGSIVVMDRISEGLQQECLREKQESVGISEIGWRTYIGNEILNCDSQCLQKIDDQEGLTVETKEHFSMIQIGDTPIWGYEVDAEKVLQSYKVFANAITKIHFSLRETLRFDYGFDDTYLDHDLSASDRYKIIGSYFNRFAD